MNILDLVKSQLSDTVLNEIGNKVGADGGSVSNAVSSLLPALVGGLSRNGSNEQGASSIMNALDRDHDGSILNDITGFFTGGGADAKAEDGDKIANHILQNDRPAVEAHASQASGLNIAQIGGVVARLAPVLMGVLGQQKNQNGLDIGGLMGLLGGQQQHLQNDSNASGSGVLGMLSGFLDQNKDGNVMDDISGMIGNFFKK